MRKLKKLGLFLLIVSLTVGGLCSGSSAQDERYKQDPIVHEWNLLDIFIARPLGVAAGIVGTGFFIASLPFTIPAGSVDGAAEMLIVKPFTFSFTRKLDDQDIY